MNKIEKANMEQKAQQILDALTASVDKALEKKRRLGQYAVIWDGEKVVRILPKDMPKPKTALATQTLLTRPDGV